MSEGEINEIRRHIKMQYNSNYHFSIFHETFEEAKAEAERLCMKEHKEFIVLKVVGKVFMQSNPVVWEE